MTVAWLSAHMSGIKHSFITLRAKGIRKLESPAKRTIFKTPLRSGKPTCNNVKSDQTLNPHGVACNLKRTANEIFEELLLTGFFMSHMGRTRKLFLFSVIVKASSSGLLLLQCSHLVVQKVY